MEQNGLKKKYGLFTAIAMVVGIVIGSGVFFKAQSILAVTGGNMWIGILAWIIGGIVMVICACAFAVMATKFEKTNGAVDYAEATCGKKYSYYMGWFMATIYYPAMTSVLAWVSARYFCELLGWNIAGAECMTIAGTLLVCSFVLNSLAPKISGKFQVSTTVIKLIPLLVMVFAGTIFGLINGITVENFTHAASTAMGDSGLFKAIVATAFAYEGWIIATSINSEIKDSKKNLPKALLFGSIVIVVIYVLYFIGVAGAASTDVLISDGVKVAFTNIFGTVGGTILTVFVMISCLGTLNGLTMGSTRALYGIATRDCGPKPDTFKQVDKHTDMPTNSCLIGLLCCSLWLLYFFGANLTENWFGVFGFDSSELPIITIYAFYIPIFINWIIKQKEETKLRRFVLPIMAIVGCVFMIFCAIMGHGVFPYQAAKEAGEFSFPVLFYLIVFAVIMLLGLLLNLTNKKKSIANQEEKNLATEANFENNEQILSEEENAEIVEKSENNITNNEVSVEHSEIENNEINDEILEDGQYEVAAVEESNEEINNVENIEIISEEAQAEKQVEIQNDESLQIEENLESEKTTEEVVENDIEEKTTIEDVFSEESKIEEVTQQKNTEIVEENNTVESVEIDSMPEDIATEEVAQPVEETTEAEDVIEEKVTIEDISSEESEADQVSEEKPAKKRGLRRNKKAE